MGEDLAAAFLSRRGASIIARNVRRGRGEIDLHVRFGSEVAAVEVKTRLARPGSGFGPADNLTPDKLERVRRVSRRLSPPAYRIDFVGVAIGSDGVGIHWIPNAG